MSKKHEIPKLNAITFHYIGDQNKFNEFLSNMAADYLNSEIFTKLPPVDFVDSVEFSENSAIPLDK